MKVHTKFLFIALGAYLLLEQLVEGGITKSSELEEDTIYVTMRNGKTYEGYMMPTPSVYAPNFLIHHTSIEMNLCYIRTAHGRNYVAHIGDLPSDYLPVPERAIMKIGRSEIYSANNFVRYDENIHRNAGTSNSVQESLPVANHVYLGFREREVYASALH